jgi:hypothetical protein
MQARGFVRSIFRMRFATTSNRVLHYRKNDTSNELGMCAYAKILTIHTVVVTQISPRGVPCRMVTIMQ